MTQVEHLHQLGELSGNAFLIASAIKVIAVFTGVMVIVAMLTLLERKIAAWMQDRLGPNRVGPSGLLQPVADGIKNILKEETYPAEANRVFFIIAPMMSIIPALVTFAVIPFAAPLATPWGVVPMVIADVPVGVLFLIAFSSLGVYGIVMAGWASNNKYALLGGLRAGAQMISYEIPLGLSLLAVFFLVGNVRLTEVVHFQQEMGLWFALPLAASFFFFWVSTFAETNRLSLRPPRGRGGAGDRIPHRVLLHEVLRVHDRGVRARLHGVRAHGHALPRGLGHPLHLVGPHPAPRRGCGGRFGARAPHHPAHLPLLPAEDALLHPRLHAGAVDGAAVPL
jgi:formate hydrogenlyase subunit 4